MPHVPQCKVGVIVTFLIDQTALIYSHPAGLLDRYLRETRVCGFPGFVFGPCRKTSSPPKGVGLFGVGRVANPPNLETRRSSWDSSGRDALARVPACLTLLGVPWSPVLYWLHTVLVGSYCRDSLLYAHALIRSPMLLREWQPHSLGARSHLLFFVIVIDENDGPGPLHDIFSLPDTFISHLETNN